MRYIMTIIWAVLISGVIAYVLSNMADDPFNFLHSLALAGIIVVAVIILGEGVLKESKE